MTRACLALITASEINMPVFLPSVVKRLKFCLLLSFLGGVLKKDEFKIIYVAPMKALAAEMVRNFSNRLDCLGKLAFLCVGGPLRLGQVFSAPCNGFQACFSSISW